MFDATARGTQYRVLAAGVSAGYAVLITHSLTEASSTLSSLRLTLVILTLGGVALASLLGWFVGRTTLAPVRRLTATIRRVADTLDLGERIEEGRRDEIGSLASSFNAMLAVLDDTVRRARRVGRACSADSSPTPRTSSAPR